MKTLESKDEIHLQLVLWFCFGILFCPHFSGLFLVRIGRGLENWLLKGMYGSQL